MGIQSSSHHSQRGFQLLAIVTFTIWSLFGARPALAQAGGARIRGTVTDATGAGVAGAAVELTQTTTAVAWRTLSDAEGAYSFMSLPVGEYRLAVSAPGFKKSIQERIVLEADQRAEVGVILEIGAVTETLKVTAELQRVDTQTGTLKQIIDPQRMVDLPLNGRDTTQLLSLVAGVALTTGQNTKQSSTLAGSFFAVNGARDTMINFQMDGTDHNDPYTNVNNPFPNPDALEEFSVQTNNYDAEFGRNSGAVVNVVTRSGTNAPHGSLFEFLRNGDLNARNFFSSGQDSLKRNQFGGSFGGPVRIPRIYDGHDRTFFFFSYQPTELRQAPSSFLTLVASPAQRRGDFSTSRKQLVDPLTSTPFSGNQISASRFDPTIQKMMETILPLPNQPNNFLNYSVPSRTGDRQAVLKVDQRLAENQRLSVRYFLYDLDTPSIYVPANFFAAANGFAARNQNVSLNHTWTITPRLVNTATFGFNRLKTDQPTQDPYTMADFGAKIYSTTPKTISVAVAGYFTFNVSNPVPNARTTFQYNDTMSFHHGPHLLKWGADLRRIRQVWSTVSNQNGAFSFSGDFTGDALADYIVGKPIRFQQSTPIGEDLRFGSWAFFVQDNIRVSRKLSLDLGLRWEPYLPPHFAGVNQITQFRPVDFYAGNRSQVFPNAPPGLFFYGDKGVPLGGTNSYIKALSPRVGMAYDLGGKSRTVFRMAYGVFWDQPKLIQDNGYTQGQPFSLLIDTAAAPSVTDPYAGSVNPFPGRLKVTTNVPFVLPLSGITTYGQPYIQANIQQWNANIEHLLGGFLLRAAYVGAKGTHLNWSREINPGYTCQVSPLPATRIRGDCSLHSTAR